VRTGTSRQLLDTDPVDADDDLDALGRRAFVLAGEGPVALVVPEGTDGAVHTAAAGYAAIGGGGGLLDYRARGDVLEDRLLFFARLCLFNKGIEDVVLQNVSGAWEA